MVEGWNYLEALSLAWLAPWWEDSKLGLSLDPQPENLIMVSSCGVGSSQDGGQVLESVLQESKCPKKPHRLLWLNLGSHPITPTIFCWSKQSWTILDSKGMMESTSQCEVCQKACGHFLKTTVYSQTKVFTFILPICKIHSPPCKSPPPSLILLWHWAQVQDPESKSSIQIRYWGR